MTLDVAWADRWARLSAERIAGAKDELTELDRQIGDGDHGENLDRGFRAVVAKLDDAGDLAQVGDLLKLVATTLMSSVGGASGPLYGTAYLRAAKVTGLETLDAHAVVALLEGALEGITARGKAVVGEKTMVDAWQPAVDAAEAAANDGGSPVDVLAAAASAADAAARATVPLVATKGRASYLGERSVGHQDPGATSTAILLAAARDAAAVDVGDGR
ncbi:dihydroxyacetone kinase subunit DhaL [Cellulosimicrobium arenosum]|uniref:Dihydroxyacetone kinase subunit L n=1 Tax=Cellulosimicrobium arenosum TaxID=2708133 RepID=A0A927IZF3_9MICO|nr:dihydroxyacetone kinase subunit DhaL [Cellulosimicrobium arenosum]MBD8079311.1 dihydroxyacetone kinase subunit L [Cellulosimicrobium arenosum]